MKLFQLLTLLVLCGLALLPSMHCLRSSSLRVATCIDSRMQTNYLPRGGVLELLPNKAYGPSSNLSHDSIGSLVKRLVLQAPILLFLMLSWHVDVSSARPEGVDRPDLLPSSPTTVIDVANFLRYHNDVFKYFSHPLIYS